MSTDRGRVGVGLDPSLRRAISPYAFPAALRTVMRDALLAAGLGQRRADAPLADVVERGATVLLKPNWVLHFNKSGLGMDCMVTHGAFVLAVLREVMAARPGRVIIGDAPVQSANFAELAPPRWREEVAEIVAGTPAEVLDFRHVVSRYERTGLVTVPRDGGPTVEFDLGRDSLLDEVAEPPGCFRITSYDPARLAAVQRPGIHRYLLSRSALAADVVINVPKLKAHGKAGITAALKNLVGINSDKNYLPHHRLGGAGFGGDCYPGRSPVKRLAELCLDRANQRIGTPGYIRWHRLSSMLLLPHRLVGSANLEGLWYGNDTVWRMALDLNRLLRYGRDDGTLSSTPQRAWYSITDALVAGQGEGPLAPTPLRLGLVTCAGDPAAADVVHASVMSFDWRRIPLIREAFRSMKYPVCDLHPEAVYATLAGERLAPEELASRVGARAVPPRGWRGHIERD